MVNPSVARGEELVTEYDIEVEDLHAKGAPTKRRASNRIRQRLMLKDGLAKDAS